MSDPLRVVWDALDAGGYGPHGPAHDFRARCPAHDGDNLAALHVSVGGDGRALLHCFAHQCEAEAIAEALGLCIGDLFPPGHKHARRRHLPDARRADFTGHARTVANVLKATADLDRDWYVELRVDCPHCDSPFAVLFASPHYVTLSCPGDAEAEALGFTACTLDQFLQALAGRIEDDRREAA